MGGFIILASIQRRIYLVRTLFIYLMRTYIAFKKYCTFRRLNHMLFLIVNSLATLENFSASRTAKLYYLDIPKYTFLI